MKGIHAFIFIKDEEKGLLALSQGRAKSLVPVFGGNRIIDSYINPLVLAGLGGISVLTGGERDDMKDYFLYRYGAHNIAIEGSPDPLGFLASARYERGEGTLILRAESLLFVRWEELLAFLRGLPAGDYHLRTPRRETIGFFLVEGSALSRAKAVLKEMRARRRSTAGPGPVESGPAGDGETGGLSIEKSWDILSRALAKSAKPTTFPASLFPFRTVSEYYGGHFEILRDLEAHVGLPQLLPIEKVDEKSLSSVGPTGHVKDSYLSYSCVVEGYVERSVIFPHVRIGKNAKVIGSVVLDYNSIGTGAVVHNTILCDNGELFARMTPNVGEGARVGGEDETGENTLFPRFINGGVTLIGRNVEIPRGIEVSSNCYIASETGKAAFKGRERVRASETILES